MLTETAENYFEYQSGKISGYRFGFRVVGTGLSFLGSAATLEFSLVVAYGVGVTIDKEWSRMEEAYDIAKSEIVHSYNNFIDQIKPH